MIIEQKENKEKTLGHIVSEDYRKSRILNRLGVDYSCGGSRTLGQVFIGQENELQEVLQEWESLGRQEPKKEMDFLGWDIAFLAKYIIQLHHRFVSSQTRFIAELAFKVADSNSTRNPEIKTVAELFADTGKKLEMKGLREENELFPYIIAMHDAMTNGTYLKAATFGPVSIQVTAIRAEGEQIVAGLRQIRRLTNNYIAPAYTTSTCPILYKLLAAYEEDALLHLHLENNILFPKAIHTENSLRLNHKIA